ncbi:MAG TPA: hypothetical protein VM182_03445 [Terriglobia bacterium]|nr:hypothetical protein [Terriglobia bacterium]
MKMRRKGFLAALAGMVAAPVLGKVPGRAKRFPRYFTSPTTRSPYGIAYLRADSPSSVFFVFTSAEWPDARTTMTIKTLELAVAECASWREITAAEAEALLKPQYDHPSCTLTITKDTDWDDVDEESLRLVARAKADLIMSAASITMKRGHEA